MVRSGGAARVDEVAADGIFHVAVTVEVLTNIPPLIGNAVFEPVGVSWVSRVDTGVPDVIEDELADGWVRAIPVMGRV
jgi:hypothetical protein